MNLHELQQEIGTMEVTVKYGGLPLDLVGALGGEVIVPRVLHDPSSEISGKLVRIKFVIEYEALWLSLCLEKDDKLETIIIPGIVNAAFDHGFGGFQTMAKYYVTLSTGETIRIFTGFSSGDESEQYQREHFGEDSNARVDTRMI